MILGGLQPALAAGRAGQDDVRGTSGEFGRKDAGRVEGEANVVTLIGPASWMLMNAAMTVSHTRNCHGAATEIVVSW